MDLKLIQKLQSIQEKIDCYNQSRMITKCPYIKNYYGYLIEDEIEKLQVLIDEMDKERMNRVQEAQKQFTLEELAKYNGANGSPAYVAVNGIVYDVSLSPVWGGGTHFGLYAGQDLTSQFKACHNGEMKLLDNLPKVGKLKI